ncbi:thioredoxin family protein [Rhodohalobacter sp. 614A]|uniref:thioredoxin family protein n=1 Tax=Rhodohalobacter sp. 614A TaxID=2908649 RepID=UPI001F21DBFF|nr:thioredoxin family protein [Rhodohalobacter sp. 614A]
MRNFKYKFKFVAIWVGMFLLMGALFGSPLPAQNTSSVDWYSFEKAIQLAEENQQLILVDVWAPWCGWCKKMEKEVYPELSKNITSQFIWTRLNRDDNRSRLHFKEQRFTPLKIAQKLNTQSVPALVVLSPDGDYLFHISGFTKAKKLESILEYVITNTLKSSSI